MTRRNKNGAQRPHHYFTKIRSGIVAASLCGFLYNGFAGVAFGGYDCGQWFVSAKREPAKSWLIGFLSGINSVVADDKAGYDPLDKVNSADQIFLWMDNYCKTNPLKRVSSGAQDLYFELEKKK